MSYMFARIRLQQMNEIIGNVWRGEKKKISLTLILWWPRLAHFPSLFHDLYLMALRWKRIGDHLLKFLQKLIAPLKKAQKVWFSLPESFSWNVGPESSDIPFRFFFHDSVNKNTSISSLKRMSSGRFDDSCRRS